jgi:hypothetical protein
MMLYITAKKNSEILFGLITPYRKRKKYPLKKRFISQSEKNNFATLQNSFTNRDLTVLFNILIFTI